MSVLSSIGRVGPALQADGTTPAARMGKTAEAIVAQAHGKYYEACHRGKLFAACTPSGGVAPGTSVGTTGALCLANPAGSGVRLAVKKVTAGYISGTLGAGTIWHCVNGNSAGNVTVSSGTALTTQCCDVGNGATSTATANSGGTISASATRLYPFATINAEAASTATNPTQLEEDIDGGIVVEPGCVYSLQGETAAGTSPKMAFGVVWEEVPIV